METVTPLDVSNVLPARAVRVLEEPARVFVPGATDSENPHIHLVREGNHIKAIEITCSCGQRMRLSCVYG